MSTRGRCVTRSRRSGSPSASPSKGADWASRSSFPPRSTDRTAMQHDKLRIQIDGAELADLHCDLISLEVELDDQLAGMFRLTLALLLKANGKWKFLDEERFSIWRRVVITAGLKNTS